MVNLASRTIDDHKNLLSHSKKIKKSPLIEPKIASPLQEKNLLKQTPFLESFNHRGILDFGYFNKNVDKIPQPRPFPAKDGAMGLSLKFDAYQPFYTFVFCPDAVQELFSMKDVINPLEMREKVIKMKTPASCEGFQNSLEKMRCLTGNQDLLIQSYLKDKYTERPNPVILSEYYRYIKRKLSLAQIFEMQAKKQEKNNNKKTQHEDKEYNKKEEHLQSTLMLPSAANCGAFDHLNVFYEDKDADTRISFVNRHCFEEKKEEETKNEGHKIEKIQGGSYKHSENFMEDFLAHDASENEEMDHPFNLKFNISKKHAQEEHWMEEDDIGFNEKERLYSIL